MSIRKFTRQETLTALHERSRTGHEMAFPQANLGSHVEDLGLLIDFARVADSLGRSRGNQFKPKGGGSGSVRLTGLAQDLLDVATGLRGTLSSPPAGLRFDPRVEVLADALRRRKVFEFDREGLYRELRQNSLVSADALNGAVNEVRGALTERQSMRLCANHRTRWLAWATKLDQYFSRVAKAHPNSSVLRIEAWVLDGCIAFPLLAEAQDQFVRWLLDVTKEHEASIGGLAWKIDRDLMNGFFCHVVCAVDSRLAGGVAAIARDFERTWKARVPGGGQVRDCKAPDLDLVYRGQGRGADYMSVREELYHAAVYLGATDALVYWEAGPNFPTHGFGELPAVQKWPFDSPEFEQPRWRA